MYGSVEPALDLGAEIARIERGIAKMHKLDAEKRKFGRKTRLYAALLRATARGQRSSVPSPASFH